MIMASLANSDGWMEVKPEIDPVAVAAALEPQRGVRQDQQHGGQGQTHPAEHPERLVRDSHQTKAPITPMTRKADWRLT